MKLSDKVKDLELDVAELKRTVKLLTKFSGLDMSELRLVNNEALLSHYRDAVQLLGYNGSMSTEVIDRWSEIFNKLSEVEFLRLQRVVDYEQTWEPFLRLCLRMMSAVRTSGKLESSLVLQNTYAMLDKGRRGMRDGAVVILRRSNNLDAPTRGLLLDDDVVDQIY